MKSHRHDVVHVTTVHNPRDPRITYRECRSLAQSGVDVALLAPRDVKGFAAPGFPFFAMPRFRSRPLRASIGVGLAGNRILSLSPRIAHLHDPELLWITPLLRLCGVRVVYDVHEDYSTAIRLKRYLPRILRPLLARLFDNYERFFASFARTIIAERYYRERFPRSVEILNYPPADFGPSEALPSDIQSRVRTSTWKWFVYAGNVTEDRGAILQLQILTARSDTAILYIGYCPGRLYRRMRAWLEEHSISSSRLFVVGVDQYVAQEWIADALFVLPFRGALAVFPLSDHYYRKELTKIYEYIRADLPVIASDFPVWRGLIARHTSKYELVDPGSVADIRRATNRILDEGREMWSSSRRLNPIFDGQISALKRLYASMGM